MSKRPIKGFTVNSYKFLMEKNNTFHAAAFPRKVQLVLGINLDWICCRWKCLRPVGNRFLLISFLLGHFAVWAIPVYQQTYLVQLPSKGTNINLICGCFFKRSYIYIHRLDGCGVGIKWRSTGEDSNIPLAFPHIRARSRRLVIYMIINLSPSTYYHSWRSCGLVTRF